jgi:hypothetical protein
MMAGVVGYVAVAIAVTVFVWRATRRSWDPRNGGLWGHVARAVIVSVACGAAWPGALVLFLLWQTRRGRQWINWWVDGPEGRERP